MKAAQIEQNISVSTIVDSGKIPEGQLRPLAKLEPEQQREAWTKAIETAPEGKMTAAHVQKVVREMTEAGFITPPLAFTWGRFRGMGFCAWICAMGS